MAQQVADLADLPPAADEARDLGRQVGRCLERSRWWEIVREARPDQLRQALGALEVLESILAQVAKPQAWGQRPFDERTGGGRDQDLTPVGGRGDPCCPMDVEAHVIVPAQRPLSGVQPHAHANGPGFRRPRFGRERALGGSRRGKGRGRALEDHEEGVPLGRDLDTAGRFEGGAKEARDGAPATARTRCPGPSRDGSNPRCRRKGT